MRTSLIFRMIIRLAFWPLIALAVFLLLRGHHLPGGGFIGGLVAGAAFSLWAYAFGARQMQKRMAAAPVVWIVLGLTLAYLSGFAGDWFGEAFLQSLWLELPLIGAVGTPTTFDLGVFTVVVGMVTLIVHELFLSLGDEAEL